MAKKDKANLEKRAEEIENRIEAIDREKMALLDEIIAIHEKLTNSEERKEV